MKYFIHIITTVLLTVSTMLNAQEYNIKVSISNLPDSTIYLGYFYGDKQFAKDTISLDKKGNGVFSGNEALDAGVYFVLLPNQRFFELMIGEEQHFEISTIYSTDPTEVNKNLKCKGNKEMDVYIKYQEFMGERNAIAIDLRKRYNTQQKTKEKEQIQDSLKLLHSQVKANWDKIEHEHPESLIATILKLNKEIDIPEPPLDKNGVIIDSMFQYKYYKKHYFDYVDFSDSRIIRTEFFHPKLERYFEKMIIPAPDTIIKESKYVLDMAEANEEVFKYTLSTLFNKYNNSNIMGMDKTLVFFAEDYYLNGKAHWSDSTWLVKLEERVREIKPNLVGNKAPNLNLTKPDDNFISLYEIEAEFTILFFYEPTCGHCKKTTPIMKELLDKYWEKGVEVMAIYTQQDKDEWTKYIKDQDLVTFINAWDPHHQSYFRQKYDVKSTPTIYLLDKNKRIIGKRIDVETVERILEDEFKQK